MTADLSPLVSMRAAGTVTGRGDGGQFPGTVIFSLFVELNSEMKR